MRVFGGFGCNYCLVAGVAFAWLFVELCWCGVDVFALWLLLICGAAL